MTEELKKKVDRAIKLLQSTCQDQQVEWLENYFNIKLN